MACSIPAGLLEVKNGVLVIGFPSELLRSKVDTPELIEITRKAIAEVCGSRPGDKMRGNKCQTGHSAQR